MTVKHLFPAVEPSLNLDFANSKKLDPRITFTRSSTGTYVDSNGLIKTAAANEARFDHDPVSGSSLGLLVEESRSNIQLNSAAPYSSGGSQIVWTTGLTAPDGTSTAVKLAATAVDTYHYVSVGIYPSSMPITTYTYSVYAKSDGSNRFTFKGANLTAVTFDLSTGTVVTGTGGSITPAGNGWYRCSITEANSSAFYQYNITLNADDEYGYVPYLGDGTSGIILWGWQMEAGAFPTSYIPTSGSTVTRSADVASMTGTNFSSWYNQTEGTWFVEPKCPVSPNNQWIFALNPSGTGEDMLYRGSTNTLRTLARYRGDVFDSNAPSGQFNKVVLGYELTSQASSYFNAVSGTYSSIAGNTGTPTSLVFGLTAGNSVLNGTISRLTYYPTRLTNAQLQALTL